MAALAQYPAVLVVLYIMDRQHKGHLEALRAQREELAAWHAWSRALSENAIYAHLQNRPPPRPAGAPASNADWLRNVREFPPST